MPIQLNDVTSFTVEVDVSIWAGGSGFFGDLLTSTFGFQSLGIAASVVEGEPAVTVSEAGGAAMLCMGALLLLTGVPARRRKGAVAART